MYAPALEALFLTCLPESPDGELIGDLVRRIRNVRARYSNLDPRALAAKEADLTDAWMDRRGNLLSRDLRNRFKAA